MHLVVVTRGRRNKEELCAYNPDTKEVWQVYSDYSPTTFGVYNIKTMRDATEEDKIRLKPDSFLNNI